MRQLYRGSVYRAMAGSVIIEPRGLNELLKEAELKVAGIVSIPSPKNLEQIAKATFTIAGKEFVRSTNKQARSNPSLKHVYEWKAVGADKARLFKIIRSHVAGGHLTVSSVFTPSKTRVPVSPALAKSGGIKSRHIFRNKASVMENGNPVYIRAKSAQALVFNGANGLVFIRKPRGVIVNNPGGNAAKNGFAEHMRLWFGTSANIQNAMYKTAIFRKMEVSIAKELTRKNAGAPRVYTAIKRVTDTYAKGVVQI